MAAAGQRRGVMRAEPTRDMQVDQGRKTGGDQGEDGRTASQATTPADQANDSKPDER